MYSHVSSPIETVTPDEDANDDRRSGQSVGSTQLNIGISSSFTSISRKDCLYFESLQSDRRVWEMMKVLL